MSKIIDFLRKLWTFINSRIFLYIIIGIVSLWIVRTCSSNKELKREKIMSEQNISALSDTIKTIKLKDGSTQSTINSLVASEKDLKSINSDLYEKVKKQKGKIISLNQSVIQLKQDSLELAKKLESILNQPIEINDSTYSMGWTLKYKWDSTNFDIFEGSTTVGITKNGNKLRHLDSRLINRTTQIDLTFGEKIVDKKLQIFIQSNYPGFSPKSMEGIFIDPNDNPYIKKLMKKKQFFPNTWSVSLGGSTGFNFMTGTPYVGVGVNVGYTIFQW